jgi:hypothetical protein
MLGSLRHLGRASMLTWTAWCLASVLFLFTVENIWLDPWFRNKSHNRMPSLVPEAPSGVWFLAFALGGIALTLLVVYQILLIRNRNLHVWTKVGTGIVVFVVLLLCVQWFRVTAGQSAGFRPWSGKTHRVMLTWKASSSAVVGYNVYRSTAPGGNYRRMNFSLIRQLTYIDNTVQSGVTYYYVARAVDARGNESVNSNETSAAIP